ncbi:MAG: hydrogenase expression/formation protein HypE [Deltaproteobacteria bacterium]|nr:hydrogenase expression/formation protein HypE [Deltaproteobacteria bacterium]
MGFEHILMDHGSGGELSHRLVKETILPLFDNPILSELGDGAVLDMEGTRLAFSTDTFVVDPIFFPGGSIGSLAVNGTVNDLAMCGATPLYLSVGLILEEGFPVKDLERVLSHMRAAAKEAAVEVVTGDTKVVGKGAGDKVFINTAGIGLVPQGLDLSGRDIEIGDKIIVSGYIGDHGVTILTQREGLGFDAPIKSDTAPLNHLVRKLLSTGRGIRVLRDPTRGGVGTVLNEIAQRFHVGIMILEEDIPVRNEVAAVCDLLGLDPLYLPNEGKFIALVSARQADSILQTMKSDPLGRDAAMIGEIAEDCPGQVFMKTRIGGTRIIEMLTGEQYPRIC